MTCERVDLRQSNNYTSRRRYRGQTKMEARVKGETPMEGSHKHPCLYHLTEAHTIVTRPASSKCNTDSVTLHNH